jgi:uncharacterized membrane protein
MSFDIGSLNGWLNFIHVLAAISWVGGSILLQINGARLAGADRDRRLYFAQSAEAAGRFFAVAGITTLIAGVWLVARVDFWEFSQAWISIGFLGVAVGVVLGMGFYGPQTRKLIAAIGDGSAEAGPLGKRIAMVSGAETLLLAVVVWAMVFKPGL